MPACMNLNTLRVLLQHNKLLKLLHAVLHEFQHFQGPPATEQDELKLVHACLHESQHSQGPPATEQGWLDTLLLYAYFHESPWRVIPL